MKIYEQALRDAQEKIQNFSSPIGKMDIEDTASNLVKQILAEQKAKNNESSEDPMETIVIPVTSLSRTENTLKYKSTDGSTNIIPLDSVEQIDGRYFIRTANGYTVELVYAQDNKLQFNVGETIVAIPYGQGYSILFKDENGQLRTHPFNPSDESVVLPYAESKGLTWKDEAGNNLFVKLVLDEETGLYTLTVGDQSAQFEHLKIEDESLKYYFEDEWKTFDMLRFKDGQLVLGGDSYDVVFYDEGRFKYGENDFDFVILDENGNFKYKGEIYPRLRVEEGKLIYGTDSSEKMPLYYVDEDKNLVSLKDPDDKISLCNIEAIFGSHTFTLKQKDKNDISFFVPYVEENDGVYQLIIGDANQELQEITLPTNWISSVIGVDGAFTFKDKDGAQVGDSIVLPTDYIASVTQDPDGAFIFKDKDGAQVGDSIVLPTDYIASVKQEPDGTFIFTDKDGAEATITLPKEYVKNIEERYVFSNTEARELGYIVFEGIKIEQMTNPDDDVIIWETENGGMIGLLLKDMPEEGYEDNNEQWTRSSNEGFIMYKGELGLGIGFPSAWDLDQQPVTDGIRVFENEETGQKISLKCPTNRPMGIMKENIFKDNNDEIVAKISSAALDQYGMYVIEEGDNYIFKNAMHDTVATIPMPASQTSEPETYITEIQYDPEDSPYDIKFIYNNNDNPTHINLLTPIDKALKNLDILTDEARTSFYAKLFQKGTENGGQFCRNGFKDWETIPLNEIYYSSLNTALNYKNFKDAINKIIELFPSDKYNSINTALQVLGAIEVPIPKFDLLNFNTTTPVFERYVKHIACLVNIKSIINTSSNRLEKSTIEHRSDPKPISVSESDFIKDYYTEPIITDDANLKSMQCERLLDVLMCEVPIDYANLFSIHAKNNITTPQNIYNARFKDFISHNGQFRLPSSVQRILSTVSQETFKPTNLVAFFTSLGSAFAAVNWCNSAEFAQKCLAVAAAIQNELINSSNGLSN